MGRRHHPPPLWESEGFFLGACVAFVAGGRLDGGARFLFGGGDGFIRRFIALKFGAFLVTGFGDCWFGGWWFGLGGGAGGCAFNASSRSQSPPTIPVHIPSSSAPVDLMCPNLAHSPAMYLAAPGHTSAQTLPCSQVLNPHKMHDPKCGSAATSGEVPEWHLIGRIVVTPRRASVALMTTSITCKEADSTTLNFYDDPLIF